MNCFDSNHKMLWIIWRFCYT